MRITRQAVQTIAALLLFVVSAGHVAAQDPLAVGPPPSWVETIPPELAAAQAPPQPGESIRWLLKEKQINQTNTQTFGHDVLQILSNAGVQNSSQVKVDFDPSYQTLTFHWVKIRRGATVLDRLDRSKLQMVGGVVQSQNGGDFFLFSGVQTAALLIDDVRAGDILEYAYTITGSNPSLGGRFFYRVPLQLESPVTRLRTRIVWPFKRPVYIRDYLTNVRVAKNRKGEMVEFIWDMRNVPALHADDDTPDWYNPYPEAQVSEFHQWSEVAQWAMRLFTNAAPLSPELTRQVNEWRRLPGQTAQATAALQFIQDEIRYLGIESGANAYTPAPPASSFERRFGDCKDKTLLLVTVLKALGIPAYPVLVNTDARQTIASWQPSATVFDHAIVQAYVDGGVYWVDTTATYQRGPLGLRDYGNFASGLVVRPDTTDLTRIPPCPVRTLTTVTENVSLGVPGADCQLKVATVAEGGDAVALRTRYATTARDQIERDRLNFLAKLYPRIAMAAPSVYTDQEALNRVEVDEFYTLPNGWTPPPEGTLWFRFPFYSYTMNPALRLPGVITRAMPLSIAYPRHQIFRVNAAPLPAVTHLIQNHDDWVRNPSFDFHRLVNAYGTSLTLEYEYHALADSVSPAGIQDYVRQLEQASDLLDFTIESYPPPQ